MWAIAITFRLSSSVNISHFNLLLRNHWANYNQTLVEWSLGGPLPNLCPVIPTSNQDGHQAKNRKKGGDEIKKNLLLWNYWANLNQICWNDPWGVPFKIVSGISDLRPRWPPQPNLIYRTLWEIPIKIFLSETLCSIRTKFWWYSHWMVVFQKWVQRSAFRPRWLPQPNLA